MRPVLCLAAGEALGAAPDELLPAAAAVELAHTFGMVHDDLPALDDDDVRRGRATSHVEYDEATAILTATRSSPRLRARALVSRPGGRARALPGDARDDRRAVRRHPGRRGRSRPAALAEDGAALRSRGRVRARGRGDARGGAGAVAGFRVRVRAPVPGRGRRSRRRRARGRARSGAAHTSWPTRSRAVRGRTWTRFRRTRRFWTSSFRA